MTRKALGLIETIGFTAAVTAVDAATKTANVEFLGYERVIGVGKAISITVKLAGEVAAVQAAVAAGEAAGNRVGKVVASHVIPRPHEELEKIIYTLETRESIITKEEKKDIQKRQEQQAQDKHKIKKKKKE